MIKRLKIPFVIFLLILLVCAIFVVRKRGQKPDFETTKVKRGDLIKTVSASGKTASKKEVELKFQTSGKLSWVGVSEGDHVNAWQTIAQLDQLELFKNLQKYLLDYQKERWDFEQDRETYDVTEDDLDKYTLSGEVRRILEKNQFDLEKAVLDVELRDIAFKYATLITPIAGIVTRVDTPVAGINITPASAVFTISDPVSVVFKADVDEADISYVLTDQDVNLSLLSYPDEVFEGRVGKVAFLAKTTRGGGTAFTVDISLPDNNQNLKFKLGMNGDADINVEKRQDVLIIPEESLMRKKDKRYVWVVEKEKAIKKEVKIGLETDQEVEVLEGLREGEIVVTTNISKIKEGQKIE